jgi:hypothetical protein
LSLNLIPLISKTVDNAIENNQKEWGQRLASTMENQSLRLRAVFGGKPKWGDFTKKAISKSMGPAPIDYDAILAAHLDAGEHPSLTAEGLIDGLLDGHKIDSATAERIVDFYARFRAKHGAPSQGNAWATMVTINGKKHEIRVFV